MNRSSTPKRVGLYGDRKQFWLITVLQSIVLVTTAYFTAFFTYLVVIYISTLPQGPLWDESFRSPFAFIMIVVVTIALLIPYFQKEWDRGTRLFSIFSAIFLLAFTALASTHIADPAVPLHLITRYIMDPLRHALHF